MYMILQQLQVDCYYYQYVKHCVIQAVYEPCLGITGLFLIHKLSKFYPQNQFELIRE